MAATAKVNWEEMFRNVELPWAKKATA
jgi:hypothetical protein